MNGLRTLLLQDVACVLTNKPFQHGSASQLHTASSCRRFWSFFEFPKAEKSLSRTEKSPKDPRIPLPPAPREPATTSTDSAVTGNFPRLPGTSFGFHADPAVYRSSCKFHKPFAKRKVEKTSLLDGNPVPRNLKLKLQGYKTLESELQGFEMARLGDERTTEDFFEIRGDTKPRENSIQCRSAAQEAKTDPRDAFCEQESVNLAQRPRLPCEPEDTVPWHSQAPRPPSIPPPPRCPPPSQAPLRPPDPQCPSDESQYPSQTPADTWCPPNSHPDKPTFPPSCPPSCPPAYPPPCPPPCPRPCTTAPCQSIENCSFVLPPESVRKVTSTPICQGNEKDCEDPSSMSPASSPETTSQPLPLGNQMPSPTASFSAEPLKSIEFACRLSPATPAPSTTCPGSSRIPSASVTISALRLKESRTSLGSMSSGRSVSGLSSIGSVGVLTNSSGTSALPRAAISPPGLPKESKKASAAYTAKSQSSCSASSDCPKSKSHAKKNKDSCKKEGDRCKRTECFDDANDSFCRTNKPGCPGRKTSRKRESCRTRKTCSAKISRRPKRRSKSRNGVRERSSCGAKALDRCGSAACPGPLTEETCTTKKSQCPARRRSNGKQDIGTRRSRKSCENSKSSPKRGAKSERKRSSSPCSPRRATCSKETRKNNVCTGYACPGNVGPETCTTNKPQCRREKKKSATKKTRRSCSRRSEVSCPPDRPQCPGRRGSCDTRSFSTLDPRHLSPIQARFYGRDVTGGRDAKRGEDIFAKKYPKPGPKCMKSSRKEGDASCQRLTRTLSCEETAEKSEGNSMRAQDDDVRSVKDQLAKELEEVKMCKKGSRKRTTSEAKSSCATERDGRVNGDGAGKTSSGLKRVISPCKLKRVGPCKDVQSSSKKAKGKEKGKGKGCSAQCIAQ